MSAAIDRRSLSLIVCICCLALVGLLALPGCRSDGDNTRAESTGIGAGVGAAVGAVAGQLIGGDTESTLIGAGVGAAVGAGAGYAYGDHVAKKKERAASREAFLEGQIEEVRAARLAAEDYNRKVAAEIAALESEAADEVRRRQLAAEIEEEIDRQNEIIKVNLAEAGGSGQYATQLRQEIELLIEHRDALVEYRNEVAVL